MENYNSSRGLIQQMLRTRMAFRQALQHFKGDIYVTRFETQ